MTDYFLSTTIAAAITLLGVIARRAHIKRKERRVMKRVRIDTELLQRAKDEMGIKLPVRIEWFSEAAEQRMTPLGVEMRTHGGTAEWNGRKHKIRLNRAPLTERCPCGGKCGVWTLENTTHALLHELQHCAQREKIGDVREADRIYTRLYREHGYDAHPMELEANEIAERLKGRYSHLIYEEDLANAA